MLSCKNYSPSHILQYSWDEYQWRYQSIFTKHIIATTIFKSEPRMASIFTTKWPQQPPSIPRSVFIYVFNSFMTECKMGDLMTQALSTSLPSGGAEKNEELLNELRLGACLILISLGRAFQRTYAIANFFIDLLKKITNSFSHYFRESVTIYAAHAMEALKRINFSRFWISFHRFSALIDRSVTINFAYSLTWWTKNLKSKNFSELY